MGTKEAAEEDEEGGMAGWGGAELGRQGRELMRTVMHEATGHKWQKGQKADGVGRHPKWSPACPRKDRPVASTARGRAWEHGGR